jgi:hypothetical protein
VEFNETNQVVIESKGFLRNTLSEQAIDVLVPYVTRARQVTGATETDTPFYMKELVDGILAAGQLMAQASFQYSQAKARRKRAEATALLERFPKFVAERKIKGTVAEGEAFVALDDDVKNAYESEAQYEALFGYIQNTKQCLTMAHDDLKKAIYSNKDYNKDRSVTMV